MNASNNPKLAKQSLVDSKSVKAMENRLKLKLAALDDKFTKAFDRTSVRIESLRQAMQS